MKRRDRKLSSSLLNMLILIIFLASFSVIAQDNSSGSEDAKVDEMTNKLNKKLILSDDQQSEVQNILLDYFDGLQYKPGNGEAAAKLKKNADEKIQDLFDSKQKMKFSIISDDWWALAKD